MSTAEVNNESAALTIVETSSAVALFAPGFIDPLIAQIAQHARTEAAKLDIAHEGDRKELASLAYKVGRAKNMIDKKRVELVKDEKERLKKIDREGSRIWDELEALQSEVRKPLTDWENADKERVAKLEAGIANIADYIPYVQQNWQALSTEQFDELLAKLSAPHDWQEFKHRGELAISQALAAIQDAVTKRQQYDAQQAELVKLRSEAAERAEKERQEAAAREQREREARIAREATEKAERESREREAKAIRDQQEAEDRASRAEQARLDAETKAIRDAAEATRKAEAARIEAERVAEQKRLQAIEDERKRVADAAESERKAEEKRENNKRHVARVHRESAAAFLTIGFDQNSADAIVKLIAEGKVPNVRISY